MAQLRTALRAYAADDHPPAAVVERVNHLMWSLGPTAMTTLAYVVITPDEETLELVNAGHPPPLVIDPDGAASFLPLAGRRSRSARRRSPGTSCDDPPVPDRHDRRPLHRRPRRVARPVDRRRAWSACARSLRATRASRTCAPGSSSGWCRSSARDDIAVIAARVPPPPDRLRARWPAERDSLVAVRQLLRRWLRAQSATEDEIYDITVACQEACANAVEHAYRPGRESFEVEATCDDRRVRVIVRDHGRWRPPRGQQPRAGPAADARADGAGGRASTPTRGRWSCSSARSAEEAA